MAKKKRTQAELKTTDDHYNDMLGSMVDLLESARRASARAVNSIMTATYWEIGRRIVELEQGGDGRAKYGEEIVKRLAIDLTDRLGRGFSKANLEYMRRFYHYWRIAQTESGQFERVALNDGEGAATWITQTASGQLGGPEILQTPSAKLSTALRKSQPVDISDVTTLQAIAVCFPLPWSHYVKLLSLDDENARRFYEEEALRGGWSVRQLNRQVNSLFYQRTLMSKNKGKGTVHSEPDLG